MSNDAPLNLVVLISGEGSNFQAIQDVIDAGKLNARINLLISNRADANGLNRAAHAGIDCTIVKPLKGQPRSEYDQRLIEAIEPHAPGLIVLAGFMRILSPLFIQHFSGKIINIHPSLLPAYKGLDTHQRVLAAGEKYHGATVHYVIPALDSGEIILQGVVPVLENDTVDSLAERVHTLEHDIYPQAIRQIITVQKN